jgi:hypothetical protein
LALFMRPHHLLLVPAFMLAAAGASAASPALPDPLRFFDGRTENLGTAKVIFHKPYRTRSLGRGRIERDGSLTLVQHVEDEDGKAPHDRRWQVRKTAPGHYFATMSDAVGPVAIDKVGGGYRFRFRMKDNLAVEQWLTPLGDGSSAKSTTTVRKLGLTVATSVSVIRKVSGL